jgi:hypothetical protein
MFDDLFLILRMRYAPFFSCSAILWVMLGIPFARSANLYAEDSVPLRQKETEFLIDNFDVGPTEGVYKLRKTSLATTLTRDDIYHGTLFSKRI